ncbi:ADP-ribose glycohydrolase MACROD2 isoform X1 [Grus americana]|uniref:ADP-ribose glycohydrolase MACROD2 isoform X1 n=1 Tax=Grus americana TaxID=9117 RepID=UPI002407B04B|nr:ADP-ribose glycohydrolase MACROD2 isoform X1 [Grus americana]XP_054675934.1 ADP-ribose glycohydrolase MACROD2 isoform X1 [Grus americana]
MYPGNKRKKLWREEKERLLKMTLEERRKEYLREYVPLKNIPTWMEDLSKSESDGENAKEDLQGKKSLSEKVSLYRGDITLLEVDAIVNAANSSLLGGGGVDGCIHRAAGPCLVAECRNLSGCETGQAKITCGYDLPAKYVIHTVGPIARGHLTDTHKENLANCYKSSLKLAKENNIRSIAFPCISTGIYGFPNEPAAVIALNTIKEWLSKNHNEVDRIIFCVFLEVDYKIFRKKMGEFFPLDDANEEGPEPIEETGLEQKGQPPSPTKSKAEQPEDLQEDAEGGNGTEKQNTKETEAQSRESGKTIRPIMPSECNVNGWKPRKSNSDETKPSAVASLSSSEETELSEDKDSLKGSKGARESDPVHPVGCEQDQAKGQQDAPAEEEMKTGAESQSSCMEIEEPLLNQEDTTEVEMPLIHGAEEKEEEGKEDKEGGMQGKEEASVEPMKVDLACEAADVSNKDAEMSSQVESINDPTETGREA